MRLIDADRMKVDLLTVDPRYETMVYWCLTVLDAQPTVDPQQAVRDAYKHGKSKGIKKGIAMSHKSGVWMYERGFAGFGKCSVCGSLWESSITQNCFCKYCPRCGAEMVDDVIKF